MKLLILAFILMLPGSAQAMEVAQILGCHKQSCSQPRKDKPLVTRTWSNARPAGRVVGPKGFCPQNKDGYCRSVREFWDAHIDRG